MAPLGSSTPEGLELRKTGASIPVSVLSHSATEWGQATAVRRHLPSPPRRENFITGLISLGALAALYLNRYEKAAPGGHCHMLRLTVCKVSIHWVNLEETLHPRPEGAPRGCTL